MSEDVEQKEVQQSDAYDAVFYEQLNILLNMDSIDFSTLYDEFKDDKIRIISLALKIINKRQSNILKELK